MDSRPPSFDESYMTEWSLWVLDHGLPDLPDVLGHDDSVPVARWVGPRWGAVFHINWYVSDDLAEPNFDVEVFRRVDPGWEDASGSGGSNWHNPPLSRPQVPPRYAAFSGTSCNSGDGWYCCALEGLVGLEADTVEVDDADGVTRNRIDSSLGVVLVAVDGTKPATIRVRDSFGSVLVTEYFAGHDIRAPSAPEGAREDGLDLVPRYTALGWLRAWWFRRFGKD